jgi:SH3-like domain-containing protein
MSIGTYAELQTAITNWLDRTDLSSRIPEFIALFEAQINRRLRVRKQITSTTLTPSSGSVALPTDYLEWKRVTWTGSPRRELDYVTPSFLSGTNPDLLSDVPTYFTIEGANIKVSPTDNTSLDFLYAQKLPALSVSNTTNWMLTDNPDGYLWGSLVMAATFTEDAQNGAAWNVLAQQVLGEIWGLDFATRGTMLQRAGGPTP